MIAGVSWSPSNSTLKSVASSVSKSVSNVIKTSSNSLPKTGDPGSNKTLPNPDGTPKQKRWYGPDGNPERDRDYNHPDMPSPHDHEWKDGIRQPGHLPPDPSYEFSWESVLGVADDFLLDPLGGGVGQGLMMIFG
jgi:hypothetical protein